MYSPLLHFPLPTAPLLSPDPTNLFSVNLFNLGQMKS